MLTNLSCYQLSLAKFSIWDFILIPLRWQSVSQAAKSNTFKDLALKILAKNSVVITDLAQFIGKLVASEPGFTHAPLYFKEI